MRITFDGALELPAGVSAALGCRGTVVATVRRGKNRIARVSSRSIRPSCAFRGVAVLSRKRVDGRASSACRLRFAGNPALSPATRGYQLKVR